MRKGIHGGENAKYKIIGVDDAVVVTVVITAVISSLYLYSILLLELLTNK